MIRSFVPLTTRAVMVLSVTIMVSTLVRDVIAQTYPSKPLRLIVPYPAGAATDFIGRTVATKMAETLGQPVVVENRAGAGGTIGVEAAAKAPADGYTLLLGEPGGMAINPFLMKSLGYDPVRDFAAIGQVVQLPLLMLANPKLGARSLSELNTIASGRDFTFGSAGSGTVQHLTIELLRAATKHKFVHVPFKGGGPALNELIGGRIDLLMLTIPTAQPQIKAGKAVPIMLLAERRSPQLPDVPTAVELGVRNVTVNLWQGLFAPAGTPRDIIARLNGELNRAGASIDVRDKLMNAGAEVVTGTPEAFAKVVRDDAERWGRVIRDANIQSE